jgi:hypothetical protein
MSALSRRMTLASVVGAVVLVVTASPVLASAVDDADALLKEAREHGQSYLQTKDKKAKEEAEKALEKSTKLFEKAAKDDATCQLCVEGLAAAQFFKTYLGLDKGYKECLETAARGLQAFPGSARLAYYEGYAHFAEKEYADASRLLNRFLMASAGEPEAEAQARQLLEQSRAQFLDGWYAHKDYYQSNESRVTRFNPGTKQNELLLQVTPDYETGLGQQAFTQLTGNARQMQDPELQAYLDQLVNRLVEKTPGPGFRYHVTVVDSPEVNAVTPPGHIIVYTGLLAFADNEAELAGVLSHELAHNYAHHSARALITAYHRQVLAAAVVGAVNQAVRPQSDLVAMLPNLVAQLGVGLWMRAYSRQEEKEADLYGSHILFNAGYSPTALSAFFAKLYKQNPKQPPKLLSTHPPLPDRADYLIDYSEAFPLDREMKADSEAFQKIHARLAPRGSPGGSHGKDGRPPMPVLP